PSTMEPVLCAGGEFVEDFGEGFGGGGVGFGFDAEAVHGFGVVVDVFAFVGVEGAGELFDVDDVGEVGFGEAEDGVGAAGGGVAAVLEGDDLEFDVGGFGGVDEGFELGGGGGGAADGAA